MKVVVAIDSFKGCLTSKEANQAAADGVKSIRKDAEVVQVPVSDGGEGFLEAFMLLGQASPDVAEHHAAIAGGLTELTVRDPLMRPVSAKYLLRDKLAVIEIAQASGLMLLAKEERNPMVATSYGTGQLVADAVRRGAQHIIVGLGGSATSDAGIGMLRALIDAFAKHGSWDDIRELKHVRFTIASDVKNPLCGEKGAAHVFAPQKFAIERGKQELVSTPDRESTRPRVKGATPDLIRQLDERARKFADVSARHFGYDRSESEGAGAAGGLGYAFLQYLNADCKPGVSLLLDAIKFTEIVKDADLVITGEGSADRQTLMGKLPMGVLQHSGNVPVCLVAGRISDRENLLKAGFAHVAEVNPVGIALEEAMRKEVATRNITYTVRRMISQWY